MCVVLRTVGLNMLNNVDEVIGNEAVIYNVDGEGRPPFRGGANDCFGHLTLSYY